jgi:hypothetical protein
MRPMLANGKPYPRKRPVNWAVVRRWLKSSRERKRMIAGGYRFHETDWEIVRGDAQGKVIIDAVVAQDGLGVWTKLGLPEQQKIGAE